MTDKNRAKKDARVGMRASPLKSHRRKGKILEPPYRQMGVILFHSWVNEAIPEVLWSLLLRTALSQEAALANFRRIIDQVDRCKDSLDEKRLEHSDLISLSQETFNLIFSDVCQSDEVKRALSPLLLLDGLPDKERWAALLPVPSPEFGWNRLAEAVAATYDHQSQESTDCRWLKIMVEMAKGKMHFAAQFAERVKEFLEYPHRGDMRSVRPSIRSAEMALRGGPSGKPVEKRWPAEFWNEVWEKTFCLPVNPDQEVPAAQDYSLLFEQIVKLDNELATHFIATVETTGVDARHDGSFGLAFYTIQLLILGLQAGAGRTIEGRIILRAAVEALITLTFLSVKDDPTIWLQYRNYGIGQAKLAFLKFDEANAPTFVTKELLEHLASADAWLEFQDIKLGAWADKNLRKMADEAGLKSFYDKYYDGLSGYVHSNWAAITHSVFGFCANPLHRFHRIPLPMRLFSEDAVPDLISIANLALDQINKLYPSFKPRLKRAAPAKK